MKASTIFRKASVVESKCAKALDRLPERSAGWARKCVYLAKLAQAAAERGNAQVADSWLRKVEIHLDRVGASRFYY